ncbi:MAG TPA: hypothetical protein V6C99_04675 [Oculatellaceae cyanobacterium]
MIPKTLSQNMVFASIMKLRPKKNVKNKKLWDDMIFSWGFEAAQKEKNPLPQIFEVPELAEIYSKGYYVGAVLNLLK